jgi:uncharacterized protein YdaU (DUF1376 family)
MNKAPAFQWYPKDCDSDENVRLMDDAEFGFYVRCLNHAWLNEGLPGDVAMIARLFHKSANDIERIWEIVGKCFTLAEGRYVNPRQERQREESKKYQEQQKAKADAMWKLKRSNGNAVAYATAKPGLCSPSASPSALKTKQLPAKTAVAVTRSIQKQEDPESDFEALYIAHPKKGDRGIAMNYYANTVMAGTSHAEIMRVHALYVRDVWTDAKFAPKLAQWLLDSGYKYPPNVPAKQDNGYYKPYEPPPDDEL